jgi:uncharacterized protein (TIGR02001 family)
MIKSRIAVAGVLLASAGAASAAGLTVTPTIASDYDFRGISQTNEGVQDGDIAPAVQVGVNYGFENGIYAGAWASNVDFGSAYDTDVEVDAYVGYAGGDAAEGIGYDVGVVAYNYPGESDLNYFEAYAGVSHGMFAGKLWYSPEFGGDTNESAVYVEGNVTVPLPANFSALGHVGYSFGDYWKAGDAEYIDYSVGVGYTISNFSLALKYISTDIDGWDGDKVVLSASTTLPWGK